MLLDALAYFGSHKRHISWRTALLESISLVEVTKLLSELPAVVL